MDRDLKTSSWDDFSELGQHDAPSFNRLPVPEVPAPATALGCSVDLNLGGSGGFRRPEGAAKRARTVSCLVDGCQSDLTKCREYYRRHKVCEDHSKTQVVIVGRREQRFCQQCSRFHLIEEFDEVKRSCRKRLDGHNRRRRKPQPDPMSSAGFLSNNQALTGLGFASYAPTFSSGFLENLSGIIKTEDESFYRHPGREHNLPNSFTISFTNGKKFPVTQDINTASLSSVTASATTAARKMAPGASGSQGFLKTIPCSDSISNKNMGIFAEGMPQFYRSDCALSLLSSPTQNLVMNQVYMVPNDEPNDEPLVQTGQLLVPAFEMIGGLCLNPSSQDPSGIFPVAGFSCPVMEDAHGDSCAILVSDDRILDLNGQRFFHAVGEGGTEGTNPVPLPSSWEYQEERL